MWRRRERSYPPALLFSHDAGYGDPEDSSLIRDPSASAGLAPFHRWTTRSVLVAAVGTAATACAIAVFARATAPSILIGWLQLVPWLIALDHVRSARGATVAGVAMSAGFVAAVFAWFPQMVADYSGAPWLAAAALAVALAPVIEPQFITFALARHLARSARGGSPWWRTAVVGAGVYVGTEWGWPKLFADTLGHALFASPRLRQAADLAGAHGLTFAMIVGNECGLAVVRALRVARERDASTMRRTSIRGVAAPLACLLLIVGSLTAYGTMRLCQLGQRQAGHEVHVAMVQADIAHYDALRAELGTFEAVEQILETHFALSDEALARARPDLLVWPETVYPTTFGAPKSPEGAEFDQAIASFVASRHVPLLFGAYVGEGGKEFNAAILLERDGEGRVVTDEYRKTRLFPFTEYLPSMLESETVRRSLPWAGTWSPGSGPLVLPLDLGGGRSVMIAPLICYDAVAPGFAIDAVRQGAQLLVTLSNDSWFSFPGVQRLIMIVSAFRSIETRRPQLRSTPTGVSAVIDASGELVEVLDPDTRGILTGAVRPVDDARTLMLAWGDWFPPTALCGSLVALLLAYRPRRSEARGTPPCRPST